MEMILQRAGLSEEELHLAISCFNGQTFDCLDATKAIADEQAFFKRQILYTVSEAAAAVHESMAKAKASKAIIDTDECAASDFKGLLEKLEGLSESQSRDLLFFVDGFWMGRQWEQ